MSKDSPDEQPLLRGNEPELGDVHSVPVQRPYEMLVLYTCFAVFGACVLLPWNALIVTSSYIRSRLYGSGFSTTFRSWISLSMTSSNLFFLILANLTQQRANLPRRITSSIAMIGLLLGLFCLSTRPLELEPTYFFVFLMFSTITLGGGASFLDNASVGLAAKLGPEYLQAVLSGQGAIAFFVAVIQFAAAFVAEKLALEHNLLVLTSSPLLTTAEDPAILAALPRNLAHSAFIFYGSSSLIVVIVFVARSIMVRTAAFRQMVVESRAIGGSREGHHKNMADIPLVARKIGKLGACIFLVYAVTLSTFPSVTSTILSTHVPATDSRDGLRATLSTPELFVPISFIMYATGDWLGRAAPHLRCMRGFKDWRLLMLAAVARLIFIPLFLLCNVRKDEFIETIPVISNDYVYMLIMLLFSFTNGYVATLVFLAAVDEPSLEPQEVEIASTCIPVFLTIGQDRKSVV